MAVNLFFILALIVCVLGSGWSPLPMTLSLVPSQEDLKMAEASGGRVSLPAPAQLDNQYIQGVSAVIFSDHRLAHHQIIPIPGRYYGCNAVQYRMQ